MCTIRLCGSSLPPTVMVWDCWLTWAIAIGHLSAPSACPDPAPGPGGGPARPPCWADTDTAVSSNDVMIIMIPAVFILFCSPSACSIRMLRNCELCHPAQASLLGVNILNLRCIAEGDISDIVFLVSSYYLIYLSKCTERDEQILRNTAPHNSVTKPSI